MATSNDSLDAKIKIPVHWATAVIAALGIGSGGFAMSHVRIGKAEQEIDVIKQQQGRDSYQDLKIQHLEDQFGYIKEKLEAIEGRLPDASR